MSDEFRCSCGSEYRIRRNGELLHYDFEDLAAIALSGAGEEFLFFNVLYARAHDRLMERDGAHFPWEAFEIVMWELLKQGRIESSSPRELWGDEWFAALGEGHFRLAPKASNRRRSKLKLLRILRDALAYGSTTALYGALAEEVSLEGTPRDTRGREEVVHAIECWGVYLDHYCKEKIECLLCKEKNMIDRTSPNQLCLLWSSEGAEGKQHYFVYADVSGGRIDRIRFLSPDPSVMLYPIYDDEN